MYVAWLSIQYQAFTYSTASGTYGFSRVRMIFRFITIRATEPCLNLEYSGFRSRETNSPYNLIGGARRRLSSRDRVQPPLAQYMTSGVIKIYAPHKYRYPGFPYSRPCRDIGCRRHAIFYLTYIHFSNFVNLGSVSSKVHVE